MCVVVMCFVAMCLVVMCAERKRRPSMADDGEIVWWLVAAE
jgi:hypothetical protein